jgi:hypothetical protein
VPASSLYDQRRRRGSLIFVVPARCSMKCLCSFLFLDFIT